MLSNRKGKQFEALGRCPFSQEIVEFYGNWLMYMDGEKHAHYRKLIANSISFSLKNIPEIVKTSFNKNVLHCLSKQNSRLDIVSKTTHPFVINVLAYFFGIISDFYENNNSAF